NRLAKMFGFGTLTKWLLILFDNRPPRRQIAFPPPFENGHRNVRFEHVSEYQVLSAQRYSFITPGIGIYRRVCHNRMAVSLVGCRADRKPCHDSAEPELPEP